MKALADAKVPAICFDAGSGPGGLWAGDGPHSSAYQSLHLNTSRTRTEFADFPMPEDWPDYPSRADVLDYLGEYSKRFGLEPVIRFGHNVSRVRRADDGLWTVTAEGPEGTVETTVEAVVVATGHNSVPRMPEPPYPGALTVPQLHSHDYDQPVLFGEKRVLVVGGGNSAMDIAVDASYAATETYLSVRRGVWIVPKYLFGRAVGHAQRRARPTSAVACPPANQRDDASGRRRATRAVWVAGTPTRIPAGPPDVVRRGAVPDHAR